MTTANLIFQIPDDAHLLDRIVGVISDHYGSSEEVYFIHKEGLRYLYSESKNGMATVEFEDVDDPIDAVEAVIYVLKENRLAYFGITDSFEESSRGGRCEGRVYINIPGKFDDEKHFPWVGGEPKFSDHTLKVVDYSAEDIGMIISQFLPPSPSSNLVP